jgi:uncharacterized RDD family membrane protein YckC
MSVIRIATNFNIDVEFISAPFHRRLFSWIIDMLVLILYYIVVVYFMNWLMEKGFIDQGESLSALFMLFIVPIATYHLLSEIFLKGQSIGKKATGLRVISEHGGRPSISQLIIRWLIRTSDFMILIIAIYIPAGYGSDAQFLGHVGIALCLLITDIILVNASAKGQRLGDILARTILIRSSERADINETIFFDVHDTYTPVYPQVMQLSDRDMNALKGILDTARKRNDWELADRAAAKIKNHLHIESSLSPFDFLEILLKDYNFLSGR